MRRRFLSAEARKPVQPGAAELATKREGYQSGRAMRYVLRPLLMALLVTALATGPIGILRALSGDPRWSTMLLSLFPGHSGRHLYHQLAAASGAAATRSHGLPRRRTTTLAARRAARHLARLC